MPARKGPAYVAVGRAFMARRQRTWIVPLIVGWSVHTYG